MPWARPLRAHLPSDLYSRNDLYSLYLGRTESAEVVNEGVKEVVKEGVNEVVRDGSVKEGVSDGSCGESMHHSWWARQCTPRTHHHSIRLRSTHYHYDHSIHHSIHRHCAN